MNSSPSSDTESPASSASAERLFSASFVGLLLTQLLTAVNDNAFRWLVIGIGKLALEQTGRESQIGFVLTAGMACFVLPYLLLAAPAGYLADRFSKRSVIVACKVAEIVIMLLGIVAILTWNLPFLLVIVALMGAQSALFSPARMGSIPEMHSVHQISAANGWMGLVTVIATVVGMAIGNVLADQIREHFARGVVWSAVALLGVAVTGWLVSLLLRRFPAADPARTIPWDAARQTIRDLKQLGSSRPLLRVALGIMFFWAIGAMANLNIDQFAFESGAERQTQIVPLLLALVAGLGAGSVLAGVWSGGRVELGILPLGAGGVALLAMLLFTVPRGMFDGQVWTWAYIWAGALLFLLGASAGLFNVPLESYMQHRSPPESRGAILAANNFLTFGGMLVTAVLFAILRYPVNEQPLFSSRQVFLLCGISTLPVFFYIVWLIPQASIRFVVWLASCVIYRIRVDNDEVIPERGGALLVANHVSWLDGVLIMLVTARPVRMIAFAGNFSNPWLKRLADMFGVILITSRPKSAIAALRTAREALEGGHLVCIFPEGAITRTGRLQAFRPGMLRIIEGTGLPVIPVYLDELWGSIFSFSGGKFFWKRPKKWPYPVSIHFGDPMIDPPNVQAVRQAVQELGAAAVKQRAAQRVGLARNFVKTCKQRKRGVKVADSLGNELTGGGLLMRSLILRRLLRRHVLADDERHVGLLLPPTVAASVANMAVSLDRRTAVNLNYSASSDVVNQCIAQAGIRHVLTSRAFMEKAKMELDAELVYLDDFRSKARWRDKLSAALAAYLVPAGWLSRSLGLHRVQGDDLVTLIFTSGSTGMPKGVMLTETNIGSNVEAIQQVVHLQRDDVLVGILPFFHSFGYTVTLWSVMTIDVQGVYHFNPLDGRQVGKLCKKHGGTVLLATPTFLRTYLRRCDKEDFESLDAVVVGAERLPPELSDAFEEKFGIRPVEGYGTTELSPLVSANIPPSRSMGEFQVESKEGTVGRPVPGVSARITDLETGEELGVGQSGMLWIKGPNVMKGYFGREDLSAEVMQDGWYRTGDVALIDEDGFIRITGRESRFSKIGGEMVPHVRIEEALSQLIGPDEEGGFKIAVTSIPDPRKGERLVVVHLPLAKTPEQLCAALAQSGLPNLYIPSQDSFCQVDELPILGTGKLDLRGIKRIAMERFSGES